MKQHNNLPRQAQDNKRHVSNLKPEAFSLARFQLRQLRRRFTSTLGAA
jgi:hypothetical protein